VLQVCAEPIKKAARKCIHCDSYQDWHANIGMSSTVLSLLVALVSVLTAAIPVVKDAFTPKNALLTATFQGANSDRLSVLFTNQGTRPGSVSSPIHAGK
jgi:hypothetical protein